MFFVYLNLHSQTLKEKTKIHAMKNVSMHLRLLLRLIALHSFIVAILLISLGNEGIQYFGFSEGNPFFQVQGGVFHIVMCVAYIIASLDVIQNRNLLIFIIIAKFIATLYLILYYCLSAAILTILLSGIGDGIMGLAVLFLFLELHANQAKYNRRKEHDG